MGTGAASWWAPGWYRSAPARRTLAAPAGRTVPWERGQAQGTCRTTAGSTRHAPMPVCEAVPSATRVSASGAVRSSHTCASAQHTMPGATRCPLPWACVAVGTSCCAMLCRAVLCRAGMLQESQACAAAGQPEQGGCHGPDIRAAHPVPWEPCMVPPPHTWGSGLCCGTGWLSPGLCSPCGLWLREATTRTTAGGCRAGDLPRH